MSERVRKERPALSFLDAAEQVLLRAKEPLKPSEIVERAIAWGLLTTRGRTPPQTMKAKLSTDVLNRKRDSRFMRTEQNTFGLRAWSDVTEYMADRYQKALLDEDIVVFDAAILREFFPVDGITQLDAHQGWDLVGQTFPMQRTEAEATYDVIQLVSQFLVIHHGKVATHKRTRRLPEARLHGVHSLLFGGHLNPDDIAPLFSPFDPVNGPTYITRELSEEVRILGGDPSLELVGGIYDPRRDVSRQHLGVLYVVRVPDHCDIQIGERGFLQQLSFESVDEIERHLEDFENWSELVHRSLLRPGRLQLEKRQLARLPAGQVHGRFQPLHYEHLEYIEVALKRVEFLHVGITQYQKEELLDVDGASDHRSDPRSNPFTYEERAELVRLSILGLGIPESRFQVAPFPIEQPERLGEFLSPEIPVLTTRVDPWNDTKIDLLTAAGYQVEVLYERDPKGVSGTEIRALMADDDPAWERLVPAATVDYLRSMDLPGRLGEL
jgi:cytidyltransferase-like protein